jgi:hypothetical protein
LKPLPRVENSSAPAVVFSTGQREHQLQSEAPRNRANADGAAVLGKQIRKTQDHDGAHERLRLADVDHRNLVGRQYIASSQPSGGSPIIMEG